MSRADSLKKAVKQIIDQASKAIDEQNEQTIFLNLKLGRVNFGRSRLFDGRFCARRSDPHDGHNVDVFGTKRQRWYTVVSIEQKNKIKKEKKTKKTLKSKE
uniref:Uncharacterized protein n=1 Tax=Romanomermis culicivorax TaxID=13658 RepID=A0A915KZ77_ROMCU